jgi:hypothetical protein
LKTHVSKEIKDFIVSKVQDFVVMLSNHGEECFDGHGWW